MTSAIDNLLKKRTSLALIAIGLIFLSRCSSTQLPRQIWNFSGLTMGTTWKVKVIRPSALRRADSRTFRSGLREAIRDELKAVNNTMSIFLPDSEISRFNRYSGGEWFPVSPELATLVALALDVNQVTEGAFDVTVGPLIQLWGFGVTRGRGVPGNEEIREVRARTGARHLRVRLNPPALRKMIPSLYCNLSAVAKGYGVDRVARLLERRGVREYLVEIGGEVRTLGANAGGHAWRIGISAPESSGGLQRVVALSGRSMATSGDYNNYFEVNGVRYSHTIDPKTGSPVTHDLASVTVVSDDCMAADAMATGLLVMGPESGLRLAERMKIPVLMIRRTSHGVREIMSPAFRSLVRKRSDQAGSGGEKGNQ